jgi:Proteins involved in synaptic transmission and general secretion, Sec1 family
MSHPTSFISAPSHTTVEVIESITNYRDPQPDFEAVYLLMPTSQNIERIIKDFSNHKQYAAAHLFFTDGV